MHPSINSRAATGSNFYYQRGVKSSGYLEHDTVDWRRQNNIPDSEGLELGQTRKRFDTVSTTHSDSHDQKRSRLVEIEE